VSAEAAIVLAAASTAALAAAGPRVIRWLPEPDPEFAPADKVPYAELGARPGLNWKLTVVGAVVGALVGWELGAVPVLVGWIVLGGVGVVLGYVDAQTRLLPTRIIAPTYAVLTLSLVVAALLEDEPVDHLVRTGLGWLVFGGFYLVLHLVYPRGLGYGDVRLSGLLGLGLGYLGWAELLVGMYAGFLLGAVGGGLLSALEIVDRKRYPFGPFMLAGALVGLLWGESLADWYMSW
jgi:leader peptidase (prepilin peptidase)/N-methyltransferase